ncbi:MAG: inositol monophosphatase [Campylobacteraceae bacterium]|nr:inositol monophosphatase [Campylobacteraceae bacterium]
MKLEDILKEAGELLKEGYFGEFDTTFKGESDLVTTYDVMIEQLLIPKLSELYPNDKIVGEESYEGKIFPQSGVFIDPIDGTTNFVHRLPFVGISVGVWRDGVPIEGGVYNPILDEMYLAQKGSGAYLNKKRLHASKTDKLQNALLATGFPYTKSSSKKDLGFVLNSMTNLLPHIRDIRRYGSASLDLCMVASGIFDGFYEINLKPWDVAAGVLVLSEAGGCISDCDGKDYEMNSRTIIASNGALHEALVGKIGF